MQKINVSLVSNYASVHTSLFLLKFYNESCSYSYRVQSLIACKTDLIHKLNHEKVRYHYYLDFVLIFCILSII